MLPLLEKKHSENNAFQKNEISFDIPRIKKAPTIVYQVDQKLVIDED